MQLKYATICALICALAIPNLHATLATNKAITSNKNAYSTRNLESNSKGDSASNQSQTNKFSIPQMRGVNRAGAEFSCVQNLGVFDGPSDDASVQAMKKWNINVVRVPLNEDCWLGINGVNIAYSGENYRSAIKTYVSLLRKNSMTVILDLHWSDGSYKGPGKVDCTDFEAKCQKPMPDAENAPQFWKSVAQQFKNDSGVIFDLFNNPNPDKVIKDKSAAWKCLKNGGKDCPGFPYKVAGMQDLVDAVRESGANNPIMVGGIRAANDLSKWQEHVPNDPKGKIIASWHSFEGKECNTEKCWESEIAPIAKTHPIIVGELGESGCSHTYTQNMIDWLDKKQISYLGWTWNTWDCSSGPSLISDYSGTPTEFGKGFFNRMIGLNTLVSQPSGPSISHGNTIPPKGSGHGANVSSETGSQKSCVPQLRGINRSGAEYSCVQNNGIFEGPIDDDAIQAMKSWNINAVRVPLNEDCWLGINGHNAAYTGENYRKNVTDYVNRLRSNDLKVILGLHWTDGIYEGPGQGSCYDKTAKCQKPMPDKENAPTFWKSVATQFINDDSVIFDLFNEPFPDIVISDKSAAWKCLKDGGSACPGFQYEVAGMQDLVNAVRSTGATNQLMIPGLTWTNDLSRWMEFLPKDSANNIAASWHSYDFNTCNNQNCWESQITPIAARYPVIAGEIGQHGCNHDYVDKLMKWLDEKKINYLGWTWNTWDCSSGPALISDYNGTPTEFGRGLQNHLKNTA